MHFHRTAINMRLNDIQCTLIFVILKHMVVIISSLLTYVNVFIFTRAIISNVIFYCDSYLKNIIE